MSLVSVVITCYNLGAYVHDAVASVRAQTWPDLELIVVDDGSNDLGTLQALDDLRAAGVDVLRIPQGGVPAARNAGMARARGEYLFSLDADDLIDRTLIEKAMRIITADERVGVVYSEVQLFGDQTGPDELPPYRFPDILLQNVIPSAALFRRADWEAVGGYNPNMVDGWEDYDFWLSLIERGCGIVRIPEPLLHYRRHAATRSGRRPREAVVRAYTQLFRNHQRLFTDHFETVVSHILDLRVRLAQAEAIADEIEVPR
jgi:glycosyltransferase involved in cell wall biosynthesis